MTIRMLLISLAVLLSAAPAFAALETREVLQAPFSGDELRASSVTEVNDELHAPRAPELTDELQRFRTAEVNDELHAPRAVDAG